MPLEVARSRFFDQGVKDKDTIKEACGVARPNNLKFKFHIPFKLIKKLLGYAGDSHPSR
jgi:hypothetical protein